MSTDNTSQDDGQVRVAKRTYGRSRAPAAEDDAPSTSMVFDGVAVAGSLASGALVDRWSKQNTNWRETLADLDAGTEQEETEDEIKAIASRLRHGEEDDTSAVKVAHRVPQPANRLVAASSLTILPPSSSPTRAVRSLAEEEQLRSSPPAPRDLPGTQQSVLDQGGVPLDDMSGFAPDELQQSDVLPGRVEFEDAEESRNAHTRRGTPTDLPVKGDTNLELSRSLFSDEVESPLPSERSNSRALKPLRKADEQLLRKDMAALDRNREPVISRTQAPHRPVTEWLAKAASITNPVKKTTRASPKIPLTSPEDIRQFTPSSGRTGLVDANSTGLSGVLPVPASSSPTPRVRKLMLNAPGDLDSDEEEEDSLENALAADTVRLAQRTNLLALKEQALRQRSAQPVAAADDDLSIIPDLPERRPKDGVSAPMWRDRKLALQPSKDEQAVRRFAGKRSAKRGVTETHMQFAGGAFDHANLRTSNAGSRPVGQKKYHEEPVSHAQAEAHMRARHLAQARKLIQTKEEKYGRSRALPPRQESHVNLEEQISQDGPPTVAEDSEDDDDYDPGSPSAHGSAAEDEELVASPNDYPAEDDDDKENMPVAQAAVESEARDDDDEATAQFVPARRNRASRRVVSASDDEDEQEEPVHDTSLRQAVDLPAGSPALAFSFSAGSGGFSQLFAETQMPEGDEKLSDGLSILRKQEPHGLLPGAMLLPSVIMSDSQRKRDNALIAAEYEDTEREAVAPPQVKQYLNSEGFFTQSRPADYMTQVASSAAVTATQLDSTLQTGVTKMTGSARPPSPSALSPTQDGDNLRRLRRRGSTGSPEVASETMAAPQRNAFDVMGAGAREAARQARRNKPKSALVDEQAEESDEDLGWGYTAPGDDEDEDADDNGYVPDLVDDTKADDEEILEQDSLAAEKRRQIEADEDAKREAVAKKVTEGYYRHKRRGTDFVSGDEDEDEDGKPRRLTKKQRRQRRLEKDDGLFKLGDEANVFVESYQQDLESENDYEEAPMSPTGPMSPVQTLSVSERQKLMRQRGMLNRTDTSTTEVSNEETEEESQYSISRSTRLALGPQDNEETSSAKQQRRLPITTRSLDSYNRFVADESGNQRRAGGGAAGVSVVVQKTTVVASASYTRIDQTTRSSSNSTRNLSRQDSTGGSVLFERAERFR